MSIDCECKGATAYHCVIHGGCDCCGERRKVDSMDEAYRKEMAERERTYNKGVLDFQQRTISANVWRCCANCSRWGRLAEGVPADGGVVNRVVSEPLCLKFKTVPPVDVIVIGCESWTPDIPF